MQRGLAPNLTETMLEYGGAAMFASQRSCALASTGVALDAGAWASDPALALASALSLAQGSALELVVLSVPAVGVRPGVGPVGVGPGVGLGVGLGVGRGVGLGVGRPGVGLRVGLGVGPGVGIDVGVGVGPGVGLGVGLGVGPGVGPYWRHVRSGACSSGCLHLLRRQRCGQNVVSCCSDGCLRALASDGLGSSVKVRPMHGLRYFGCSHGHAMGLERRQRSAPQHDYVGFSHVSDVARLTATARTPSLALTPRGCARHPPGSCSRSHEDDGRVCKGSFIAWRPPERMLQGRFQ